MILRTEQPIFWDVIEQCSMIQVYRLSSRYDKSTDWAVQYNKSLPIEQRSMIQVYRRFDETYFFHFLDTTVMTNDEEDASSIQMFGPRTWIWRTILHLVTKKEEQALLIFERKIFRRIYGPKYENGEWKSRTNRELEEMSKWENIVKWIKGQRISWLGHLERMEEDRMPKKIFTQELEGTRRKGRPSKRWKEEVERHLQVLGVRRWREWVADRKKWKDIVRQAKAHSGL